VTFGNPRSLATTVNFSAGGDYILQLSANDGQVATSRTLTVTAITKPTLGFKLLTGGALQLSWQTTGGNWVLQANTNSSFTAGNWTAVPGPLTNPLILPINPAAGTVFYRLILTN
jgi:hypothetical protein